MISKMYFSNRLAELEKNENNLQFSFFVRLCCEESLNCSLIDSPKWKQTKCTSYDQTPYWQTLGGIWVKTLIKEKNSNQS